MTEKRDKFVRLAENRTSRALHAIRTIGNLANKSNYEFTERDVRMIRKALVAEIEAMTSRFSNSDSRSRPRFSLTDGQRGGASNEISAIGSADD